MVPKIFEGNRGIQKKESLARWSFSTKEGGKRTKFVFPNSDNAYKRMEQELKRPSNWGKYPGPHPEGAGSRNFTFVKVMPEFDCVKVHSLFFPDGRVWDSTIRDFRKIRDYELEQ